MPKKTIPKKPKNKLWRITMTAYKDFYVEAPTQAAALEHGAVTEEESSACGDRSWEFEEARAEQVDEANAAHYRKHRPDEILPDPEA